MLIDAKGINHRELNEMIRRSDKDCVVKNCLGQRFIGAGMSDRNIEIEGIPGNALGAYLNGACIEVRGNVQDAVGDTMNSGSIVIYGNAGDTAGYAMRGGSIYVKGNTGYRTGIHMKEYHDKSPVIVIGGKTGSFLGEYQAGGVILVLGLGIKDEKIAGYFPCAGMHGGKVFLRSEPSKIKFPPQVSARPSVSEDMSEIQKYVSEFCRLFDFDLKAVLEHPFTTAVPNTKNPYKQMYVSN